MSLSPIYGHDAVRNRLAGAVASGRLPQVLLFEGPRGVGKQRLALWLAQLLLCERRTSTTLEPCGECQPCRLVSTLSHPDVHWFVPLERAKKGADGDKEIELVAEALAEEMAARRERPLYEAPGGLATHSMAAVRLLLRRLAVTPAMAARKVFIVGDAERLIPQRANPEAANALLKALEEPPADAVFILTAAEPEALLPTIVSRVVRVRIPRLQDSVVTAFVQEKLSGTTVALGSSVDAAEGCIGRLVSGSGEDGKAAAEAAAAFLGAARRRGAPRYATVLGQPPYQARGAFTAMLDALLERLRAEARAGTGDTGGVVAAIARVLAARDAAQGNVNPQLLTAVLADDLAGAR
jgi:DNA polymerase-3 subunit delta'